MTRLWTISEVDIVFMSSSYALGTRLVIGGDVWGRDSTTPDHGVGKSAAEIGEVEMGSLFSD